MQCSAEKQRTESSGDTDFLNTDFFQVRLEALKQIRFKAAKYITIYYSLFSI